MCTGCLPWPGAPWAMEGAGEGGRREISVWMALGHTLCHCEGSDILRLFCFSVQVIISRLNCGKKSWKLRFSPVTVASIVAQSSLQWNLPTPSTAGFLRLLFLSLTSLHPNRRPVRSSPGLSVVRRHSLVVIGVALSACGGGG